MLSGVRKNHYKRNSIITEKDIGGVCMMEKDGITHLKPLNAPVTLPFQQNAKRDAWSELWCLYYCSILSWHILPWVSAIEQSQHFGVKFFFLNFSFFLTFSYHLVHSSSPWSCFEVVILSRHRLLSCSFIALLALVKRCSLPFKHLRGKFKTCIWLSNCLRRENSVPFRPCSIILREFALLL